MIIYIVSNAWGYNFPWESRAFYMPVATPNLVSTDFVSNALLDYFEAAEDPQALDSARSSGNFILDEPLLFEYKNTACFVYIPGETARAHNTSMMAAAFLRQIYSITGTDIYYDKSHKAMAYVINALKLDNSLPYGEHHHQCVYNSHTGFNLVALICWMKTTGNDEWLSQLMGAYNYFIENFWLTDDRPKYYINSLYPIDIKSSAQGIGPCIKLLDIDNRSSDLVKNSTTWVITNMQSEKWYFYYQKNRFWMNKIPYIRWSQAWMLYTLSLLQAIQYADEITSDHTGSDA